MKRIIETISDLMVISVSWVVLFCLLFLVSQCWAEDITYSSEVISRWIVETEQCRIDREVQPLMTESIQDLERIIKLKDEIIALEREAKEAAIMRGDEYKKLLDVQKELYEAELKKARPSVFDQILRGLGILAIGIAVGLAL